MRANIQKVINFKKLKLSFISRNLFETIELNKAFSKKDNSLKSFRITALKINKHTEKEINTKKFNSTKKS